MLARISRKLPMALRHDDFREDVMQDTYVEVFRTSTALSRRLSNAFTKWLLLIADNKLVDAIRLRQAAKRGRGWRPLVPQQARRQLRTPLWNCFSGSALASVPSPGTISRQRSNSHWRSEGRLPRSVRLRFLKV